MKEEGGLLPESDGVGEHPSTDPWPLPFSPTLQPSSPLHLRKGVAPCSQSSPWGPPPPSQPARSPVRERMCSTTCGEPEATPRWRMKVTCHLGSGHPGNQASEERPGHTGWGMACMAAEVTGQPEPRRWWEVRREHTSRKEWPQVLWAVRGPGF